LAPVPGATPVPAAWLRSPLGTCPDGTLN